MGRKAQISMSLWICFRWGGRHRYLCLYGSDSGGEEGTDIYACRGNCQDLLALRGNACLDGFLNCRLILALVLHPKSTKSYFE